MFWMPCWRAWGWMWHALNVIDCVVIAKDSLPAASGTPFRSIHCLFVLLLINFTACAGTYWELKQLLYWWISPHRRKRPRQAWHFSAWQNYFFSFIWMVQGGCVKQDWPWCHFTAIRIYCLFFLPYIHTCVHIHSIYCLMCSGKLMGTPHCSRSLLVRHWGQIASGMLTASAKNLLIILHIKRCGPDFVSRAGSQSLSTALWPHRLLIYTQIYSENWICTGFQVVLDSTHWFNTFIHSSHKELDGSDKRSTVYTWKQHSRQTLRLCHYSFMMD